MNIWQYWPAQFRNARAIGAAVMMAVAILSMLSLRCDPLVGRDDVLGLVLAIEAENLRPFGDTEAYCRVLVAVPDSARIRVLLPPPVPLAGDFIPLVAERYKKGDSLYLLDFVKWRTEGPQ